MKILNSVIIALLLVIQIPGQENKCELTKESDIVNFFQKLF